MEIPHIAINAFHVAVVGPAIAYAGYKSYKGELHMSKQVSAGLVIVGLAVILYHLHRIMTKSLPEYQAQKLAATKVVAAAPVASTPAPAASADAVEHLGRYTLRPSN